MFSSFALYLTSAVFPGTQLAIPCYENTVQAHFSHTSSISFSNIKNKWTTRETGDSTSIISYAFVQTGYLFTFDEPHYHISASNVSRVLHKNSLISLFSVSFRWHSPRGALPPGQPHGSRPKKLSTESSSLEDRLQRLFWRDSTWMDRTYSPSIGKYLWKRVGGANDRSEGYPVSRWKLRQRHIS